MDSKDERMDIYDSEKRRTDRVVPRGSFLQAGEYMLYVLALIERPSDGRFLITQRARTKKWAAGPGRFPVAGRWQARTASPR